MSEEEGVENGALPSKIRDARGLTGLEKLFLFIIYSRGGLLFSTATTTATDMGVRRSVYYRTRKSLIEKRVLCVDENKGTTSEYWVDWRMLELALDSKYEKPGGVPPAEGGVFRQRKGGVPPAEGGVFRQRNTEEELEEELEGEREARATPSGGRPKLMLVK